MRSSLRRAGSATPTAVPPPSEANRLDDRQRGGRRLLGGPGRLQLLEGGLKRRLRRRAAAPGPAAAAGRPGSARRSRGRARACRSTRPPASSARVEHALRLGVGLDQPDRPGGRPDQLEVAERLGVDREDPAGRAILGGHVGDRGPVGQRQAGQAVAVVLDELADHALLAAASG